MEERILIVSDQRALIRIVTRALVAAGFRVGVAAREEAAIKRALDAKLALVIIDAEEPSPQRNLALELASKHRGDAKVLLLARDFVEHVLKDLAERGWDNIMACCHGVQNLTIDSIDETELIITVRKMLAETPFGLDHYLPVRGLPIRNIQLTRSGDRLVALAEFTKFLSDIDCYTTVASVVTTVADELMMNAIFAAPRDEKGRPKYDDRPRTERFDLEPSEHVDFRYACDGKNVLLGVTDQFGTLESTQLLQYLSPRLSGRMGHVEPGQSAGLGLQLVFGSVHQLVFNIQRGRRTEVIATCHVRAGSRGLRALGQCLSLFRD